MAEVVIRSLDETSLVEGPKYSVRTPVQYRNEEC